MNRWGSFVVMVLAFAFARPSMAQVIIPKLDNAFAGYSYVRANDQFVGVNMNGGSAQVAIDLYRMFDAVADFGAYTGNSSVFDGKLYSLLLGPRVTLRREKFSPFGQLLFGGSDLSVKALATTRFATTVGGGVDYTLSHHFSIRPIQAEYYRTAFNLANNRQNNFRYSAGLVYRF
jgi:hypothetical protein